MEWQFGVMPMSLPKLFSFSHFIPLRNVRHKEIKSKYFSFDESMLFAQSFHFVILQSRRFKIL